MKTNRTAAAALVACLATGHVALILAAAELVIDLDGGSIAAMAAWSQASWLAESSAGAPASEVERAWRDLRGAVASYAREVG